MTSVIDRARKYISKMEPAVSGANGHSATFKVAVNLWHGFSLPRESVETLLSEWNQSHCSPPWSPAELKHKINSAEKSPPPNKAAGWLLGSVSRGTVAQKKDPFTYQPAGGHTWPERDDLKIIELIQTKPKRLADLEAISPVPVASITGAYDVIDNLFLRGPVKDPWICLAPDIKNSFTRLRSQWGFDSDGPLPRAQFIVSSPMIARTGFTKDRKVSERCLGNVGARRFLVVECDFEPEKDQAIFCALQAENMSVADLCSTILFELMEYAPLCLVVHSGGKSLHGWFSCCSRPVAVQKRFFEYAVSVGADRATWTRCQLVRMPLGVREGGRSQSVHYLDCSPELVEF